MLFAAHSISAGVVGEAIGNPFLAFLAGIVLHFALDTIPHYETLERDPKTGEGILDAKQLAFIGVDVVIGLLIIFFCLKPSIFANSGFLWGMIGGVLPDLLDNVPFVKDIFRKTKWGQRFHNLHEKAHIFLDPSPWLGLPTQIIVIALFIYWHLHRV